MSIVRQERTLWTVIGLAAGAAAYVDIRVSSETGVLRTPDFGVGTSLVSPTPSFYRRDGGLPVSSGVRVPRSRASRLTVARRVIPSTTNALLSTPIPLALQRILWRSTATLAEAFPSPPPPAPALPVSF